MQPLKAHVKNGRLVLDVPTDLPEGEVIQLVFLDDDGLDDDERARMEEELEASLDELDAGETVDGEVVMANLRSRRRA